MRPCAAFSAITKISSAKHLRHLNAYHNVVVEDLKCLSMFWVGGLPPFKQLGHCPTCEIRMVETIYALPAHKSKCTGKPTRPAAGFKLNEQERADFEAVFEEELAALRKEWTMTPPPPRAAKPAAQRFYLPAGAEDDSSDDEWHGVVAVPAKPASAYTDAKNAVVRFRAAADNVASSAPAADSQPDEDKKRDGSLTPAERAERELNHLPHRVLSAGEVTARLPNVEYVRKRYYSEVMITPGIYDIVTADGEEIRLLMENHPSNVYWSHVTPPDVPRDHVKDALDVNQWLVNARPYVIVGVGSLKSDVPAGTHRLVQRKSGSSWSWITIDETALLAADNVG